MTILIVNLRFKFLGTDIHIFLLIGVYLFTPICYSNQYLGHSLTTFQNTEFCLYERKFVTNVSFSTVRLINYSSGRIKFLASCFIKNIYFLRLLLPWGVNICLYRHNTLNAHFLTFSSGMYIFLLYSLTNAQW